ncbi:hypothetical protein ACFV3E_08470 [Streptomyces sp. NPDC059718]
MGSQRPQEGQFLGAFRELQHGAANGASLHDAVRERGEEYEDDLVRYLRSGAVLAVTTSAVYDVLSPDRAFIDGLSLLTDGQRFWHTDLAHYVERYHVALSDEFVRHARRLHWRPPQLTEEDLIRIADSFFDDDVS